MECLTPTFSFDIIMDNYFTSFCLLTHLRINNIWATGVNSKNTLRKCNIIGEKQLQKKGTWPLWTAHMKQESSVTLIRPTAGGFTLLFLNLVNLTDLVGVEIKLKENIFKNNNHINSTVTTRPWVLSTEWTRTWPSTGLVSEWKNGGDSLFFE